MIDKKLFLSWWARLEERFGQTPGADAYLRYLNGQDMGTEEFDAAASAIWATCRFFPRPAEFLVIEVGAAWRIVLDVAPRLVIPYQPTEIWEEERARIPERAWAALHSLGGPVAMRDCHDLLRFRRDFFDAYEAVVVQESRGALSLDPGNKPVALLT